MKKTWTTIDTTTKIIIPKKWDLSTIESSRESVLETLRDIKDDEIANIWDKVKYNKVVTKLSTSKYWEFNESITEDDINFLISKSYFKILSKYIKFIPLRFHNDIASAMIKSWRSDEVLNVFSNLKIYDELSKDVAIALYEANSKFLPLHVFNLSDWKEVILYYLECWIDDTNMNCISECFSDPNIDFDCDEEFVNKILSTNNPNKYEFICENIGYFDQKYHKRIALSIINSWWAKTFRKYISQFKENDKEIAFALGKHGIFALHLEYFINKDRKEISLYLLENWVKEPLRCVTDLDVDFANRLIEKKEGNYLMENIQYFPGSDRKTIVMNCINKKWWKWTLTINPSSISGKDKELFMAIFNIGDKKLQDIFAHHLADYPWSYSGLDDEIATLLIDMWYWTQVKMHQNQYKNLKTITKLRLLTK